MIALVLKTVVQHGLALFFAAVLLLSTLFVSWVLVLAQELPTLITAATGTLYYLGPLYIFYVVERLVAHDRLDGTSEFLSALPMNVFHRLFLPWGMGLAVVGAVFELALILTALLASRREGLPLSWLLQIHVQLGLFAFAWYNLAFMVAYLGRYRFLVWWLFLVFISSVEGSWIHNPWRSLLWMSPLADPVEQSRSVPPWDSAFLVFAWSALALCGTLFLEIWRGGTLPARWYQPATARQRSTLVVGAMLGMGLSSLPSSLAPAPDAWSSLPMLPAEHGSIRVAGQALVPVGEEVVRQLDALGELAEVERWPGIVLHPTRRRAHRHVRRAVGRADTNLVLLVDPDGPIDALSREIVHEVLLRQTGDLGVDLPGVSALLHGLPGALFPSPVFEQRAAYLGDSETYREVWLHSGPDIAEAVAVRQVMALNDREGWARSVLGSQRGSGVPSLIGLRYSAWGLEEALGAVGTGGSLMVRAPVIEREEGGLQVQIPNEGSQAVLEIDVLDPLQPDPGGLDVVRRLEVRGRDSIALPLDDNQRFAVRLTRYEPALEGWLCSPWVR